MAAPAAVLSILVKANTGKATTGLLRLNQSLEGTESSANKATRALGTFAKVASVGVAVGLGYTVKKAADFEEQMSSLGAVADASGKQMEQFRKQAMKAGADTKFSALDAARAQTELAKGGLRVRQIMRGGLNSALALAAAGEMDLAEAAEATVNAMKLFGLRGREAMKVADGFATAANKTTADVSDFALALKMGGSAAKAAGLTFIETTAALESLAEGGIRGSDAGTSLKAMLAQLAAPTDKQTRLAKKLNIEFFDQHGNLKSLTSISGMLGSALTDLTNKQRLHAVKVLAGTDGMRALLSLYDAGPEKMARFQRELGKEGTAADVAAKKQDNFKGKLEQLRGSIETAAIAIGTKMLPALTKATEQITDVLNDRRLTGAEKFTKLADMAGKAFAAIIPILADHAAKAAPVAAKAFVTGFLAAGVWGRLAIAGFLLAKMGGPPAFMKVGATAGAVTGTAFGTSMATTAAASMQVGWTRVAGGAMLASIGTASGAKVGATMGPAVATTVAKSGLKGKLAGMFGAWGPTLAVALAATFGPELFKAANAASPSAEELGRARFKAAREGAQSFDQLSESVRKTNVQLDRNADATAGLNPKVRQMQGNVQRVQDEFNKTAEPVRRVQQLIQNMATGASQSVAGLREKVKLNTERIRKALGEDTKAGKDALTKNFLAAASNVRQSMHNGTISVKKGTALIEEYMVKALQGMGFTKKQAVSLRGRLPGSTQTPGAGGELRPNARGGFQMGGKPSGDSIPSLLERGEYVVNRNAVRKPGVRQALDRLNYQAAPRFQQGGIVELLHPGNDPKGHGDHLHIAMSTYKAIVALGHRLQKLGWLVGEHPAFGGVGGHASGSYHYKGLAIDVNWPDASAERSKIAALLPMLGGPLGAMAAPEIARVLVGGPDSPLKALTQGALDTTRAAAQSLVGSVGGVEGAESGMVGGPWQGAMASIAKARGWSLAAWQRLVQKESGGDPTARNPTSGAFGLGQFLGATAQAYAPYGALSTNPVEQIQAMARYISDRYGNPTSALAFHDRNNWYAAGGLVGGLGKTLKKVGKSPKLRKTAVDNLIQSVRAVGLPESMAKNLKTYSGDAGVFGEYADRAGTLEGPVNGKDQAQWLADQLEALFKWRNALIRAEEMVVKRRAAVAMALNVARMNRMAIAPQIALLEKSETRLSKHPKKNAAALKGVRARLRELRPQFNALDSRIIPALTGKQTSLNTLRGDLLSSLTEVQGLGSPMDVMKTLPAVGVLGGQIFDVQSALRDLQAPQETITDTGTSERDSMLEELLRQANLRTAVSEAQFKVFKSMPQFAEGGIVPGPVGAAVPAVVHGGEGVFNREQMAAMGGTGVRVVVEDHRIRVFVNEIEQAVENVTRRHARNASRGLPGRGGGV